MKKNQYKSFQQMHQQKNPLILYNAWNVITSKLLEKNESQIVATSSYAIAESLGYKDGENLPFEILLWMLTRISEQVNIPITVDIETGYSENIAGLTKNIEKLLEIGISGINLEDQIINNESYTLRDVNEQSLRIKAVKRFAQKYSSDIFINARTDVFFKEKEHTIDTVEVALERCYAYYEAGAECFFVPGLSDLTLIERIAKKSPIPINVMVTNNSPSNQRLVEVGVKRISYGPLSYFSSNELYEKELSRVLRKA